MEKHHKDTFDKISGDKRDRILNSAICEFAQKGFISANINIIAKKAGISIGSMYNYFESKENLFLTVIDRGFGLLVEVISSIDMKEGDIFDKIEKLLRAAQFYSRSYPELNQIYLDSTSEGLSHLSNKLSRKMETISSDFYRTLIQKAKNEGSIDPDIDENMTAFCLDNLILVLQYSYTSDYFKERMKIFVGEKAMDDDERIILGMMRFIRGALSFV